VTWKEQVDMGNRFDAHLAGRLATEPTLGTTQDGKPWAKFRLAVEDRARNEVTGEWEKAQTIFHDVVVFGTLAERTVGTLHTGDPVIAQGEFRFRAYEDAGGNTRTGTSFVTSRLGPDILLSDVTVTRRAREAETGRTQEVTQDATPAPQPSPVANPAATRPGMGAATAHRAAEGWSSTDMAKRYQHVTDTIRADVASLVGSLIWEARTEGGADETVTVRRDSLATILPLVEEGLLEHDDDLDLTKLQAALADLQTAMATHHNDTNGEAK
jgi:single-strand DNA-binding protein